MAVTVGHLWFDVYKAQQSILLIEKDKELFEQLADIAQANYSSTIGQTRQQDIVRAQLELTQLVERLSKLEQQKNKQLNALKSWTINPQLFASNTKKISEQALISGVSEQLPEISMLQPDIYLSKLPKSISSIARHWQLHPEVKNWQQKIAASDKGIELAKQNYKPQFSLNASYGYRAEQPNSNNLTGQSRSDLFSLGVTFDLPLFTGKKQDSQVRSAVKSSQAIKTKKWMLLRNFYNQFQTIRAELNGLMVRQALYRNQLIPQIQQLSEASLTAYTNDESRFSEVIRARISELNASIELMNIDVEIQKQIVALNYYFMTEFNQITLKKISSQTGVAHE